MVLANPAQPAARPMFATSDDDHRYCKICGAAVVDVPAHRAFHDDLDVLRTALSNLGVVL